MNRTRIVFLTILCAFAFCVFAIARKNEPMPGGYTEAAVTDNDVIQAAEFAINAQFDTIQQPSDLQPNRLQLVKIVRAEQQVVAGTNYRLTLNVKDDGNPQRTAEAIVWWQAWRPNPYDLTSWTWK